MSEQRDWMAEAEKSGMTPAEASAERLEESQKAAHEGFYRVLTETRRALDELKDRLRG